MKVHALSLLFFLLISCQEEEIATANPNILSSEYIDMEGLHLAFPSFAGNVNRSKIIVVYRVGSSHISFDSKLVQMESTDKGKTWKNRKVIYTPPVGSDVRDPQLLCLPDGSVLCRFFERESEVKSKVKSIKSFGSWDSYSTPVSFPFMKNGETFGAARGNMALIDGAIYAVCYSRWSPTWLAKSDDLGESWQAVSWLIPHSSSSETTFGPINEASLGYANGKMYVVGRQQQEGNQLLELGVSNDLGITWTWSYLPLKGHAPSLMPFKDGFILTYRNVKDLSVGKYSFDVALIKNGKLVKGPISLFESATFDIGYGDVLTLPNSFLVCCYQPGSIRCFEVKYDIFK